MFPRLIPIVGVALLLASHSLNAQNSPISRGTWLLGGTGSFHSAKDIGNKSSAFVIDLSPKVGYFIVPHLAVSANLRLGVVTDSLDHSTDWGVGPGVAYYFGKPQARFFPYLTARTLFLWSVSGANDSSASSALRSWNESWLLGAGGTAMVAKNVGFTAELFYQHDHFGAVLDQQSTANSSVQYGVNLGVAVFVF
jgi:hypothetical protein